MLKKLLLLFSQGIRSKSIFHAIYKLKNLCLYIKYRPLKKEQKIIYVLTPPPQLANIGDHAQVIGIKKWINDKYEGVPVIEFNKDETIHLQWVIKKITNISDLIFIHSGGNMGDSGLWSEKGRRLTIENFPNNKIISLPQTIFFSNTKIGQSELKKSQHIYNNHSQLTIIARDFQSEKLAKNYFPNLKIYSCPDFVLYLQGIFKVSKKSRKGIIFCLRNDIESALNSKQKNEIISTANLTFTAIDTTLPRLIPRYNRQKELQNILNQISSYEIIITDRFHGLIFAVLTKTPCIVISTINHKLVSAFEWFDGINFVKLAKSINEIPELIDELLELKELNEKDWIDNYFDNLISRF